MSSRLRRAFELASDVLIRIAGLNRPIRVYRAFLDRVDAVKTVEVAGLRLHFDANAELHLLRAGWLATKEPETLRWIDSFSRGDVFYDVGANVGVFSVYAARRHDCRVFAFEPEAKNFACLNRNIYLNRIADRTSAFCLGLHDRTMLETLFLQGMESGAALHGYGEAVDWRGHRFQAAFAQATLAFALDEFIDRFGIPPPNHLKLDVDGNEQRILEGAKATLSRDSLRSVQVELGPDSGPIMTTLEASGLRLATPMRSMPVAGSTVNAVFRRPS